MNKDRFWELIENAWAPLGPEAAEARRVLTARSPDTDVFAMPEHSVVEKALDDVPGARSESMPYLFAQPAPRTLLRLPGHRLRHLPRVLLQPHRLENLTRPRPFSGTARRG
ncbi:hypothetical protein [Actinomadura livida]|uniref:DUF4240 domain-containing protein n=1 Tax=Actinomadura livida TaxID=79909 RepID=A0A7W7N019_9ACTN|nr:MULTISPECIES: hypothetical protein [Actinomadura]MBB4777398.1 hypothetical protein [Actinomadura catellatispora]GGU31845.1 hypothetical protein GCM10010208_65740 [Actinomadura livida]